jgi:hypothetical protein
MFTFLASLTVMFIYFRYKSAAKLSTLHTSYSIRIRNSFSLCFIKYWLYQKVFQIQVLDLSEVYILYYVMLYTKVCVILDWYGPKLNLPNNLWYRHSNTKFTQDSCEVAEVKLSTFVHYWIQFSLKNIPHILLYIFVNQTSFTVTNDDPVWYQSCLDGKDCLSLNCKLVLFVIAQLF